MPEIEPGTVLSAPTVLEMFNALEARYERLRQAYAELLERFEAQNELVRALHDIHLHTDLNGQILKANAPAQALAPLERLVGSHLADWIDASSQSALAYLHTHAQNGLDAARTERELLLQAESAQSGTLQVSAQVLPLQEPGSAPQLHWVFSKLRPASEQLDALPPAEPTRFERSSECVFMTDVQGRILAANAAFSRVTGYSAEEAIGRNPRFLQSGLQDASFYRNFWRDLVQAGFWQGHIFNRRKSGEIYAQWLTVSAARDEQDQILHYTAVFYDLMHTEAAAITPQ